MRRALRCLWALFLSWSGCIWWAKRSLRSQGAVLVLMLHRVLPEQDLKRTHSLPDIVVSAPTFHSLVAHLARTCEVVKLEETSPASELAISQIVLTFDDGWLDNYTVAFPELRAANLPFTVFVCPDLMAKEMPFWPERAVLLLGKKQPELLPEQINSLVEALKVQSPEEHEAYLRRFADVQNDDGFRSDVDRLMSWSQAERMRDAGVAFGSHTSNHFVLTRIPVGKAQHEIRDSKAAIEAKLSCACETFSYPNGNWCPETRRAVAEANLRLAVTTEPGAWMAYSDPFTIPRINISEDNITGLRNKFSTALFEYHVFWKSWRSASSDCRSGQCVSNQCRISSVHSEAQGKQS